MMPVRSIAVLIAVTFISVWPTDLCAQGRQQVKVLVEFQQSGDQSQSEIGGRGQIIITERGRVHPSGRVIAQDRQTKVQQSTGIFTIVQDGGESYLSVATRVPYVQVSYFRNYAAGAGYITSGVVFEDVGTSLKVHAAILPDKQIRVRLTPRISYFSPRGSGVIDFTEASTELIVPSGSPVVIGGATTQLHEVTRQLLGFGSRQGASETTIVLTASIL